MTSTIIKASVLVAAAAYTAPASGVVNTIIRWQVSRDGTTWVRDLWPNSNGETLYVRAVASYIPGSNGTSVPIGLASFVFQPTISNWNGATDTLNPFVNGGQGGNTSTPLGVVTPAQADDTMNFGRLSPWGRTSLSSTSFLKGFVHTNPNGDNINYLRIAQAQVTGWIGFGGNTTGGSGVPISQLNDVGRTTADPAFNPNLTDIVVFKYSIHLGAGHTDVMLFDSPLAAFGNRNSTTGDREVYWFANSSESTGSIRGTVEVFAASTAPAPGTVAMLGFGGMMAAHRCRKR